MTKYNTQDKHRPGNCAEDCGCPLAETDDCLVKKFFDAQKDLPIWRRSAGALISCSCKRCSPHTL